MNNAWDIAKEIINSSIKKDKPISNLKLQKILYYVQGYSFKLYNKPAFSQDICAWTYGPVVPDVYNRLSRYASRNITDKFTEPKLDAGTKEIVETVLEKYLDTPIWELVNRTHDEDPWNDIYMIFGVKSVIPKNTIKKYFCSKESSI